MAGKTTILAAVLWAMAAAWPQCAAAQSAFDPVIRVNEEVVTRYELDQRRRFLTLLNAPPEIVARADERLIDERLQLQEARRQGIDVGEGEIVRAQEQFVTQGRLNRDEFIAALEANGVAAETFRDFVQAGIAFRELVRARFGPSTTVTDADVTRALRQEGRQPGQRVLLSEIVLPARTEAARARARERAAGFSRLDAEGFAAAARTLSSAESRTDGGELDWLPLEALPARSAARVADLAVGQVSGPIDLPNSVVVFRLRDREVVGGPEERTAIDYAQVSLPGLASGRARQDAARIAARADTCDDLWGVARGSAIARQTQQAAAIPGALRQTLTALDAGETALLQGSGDTLTLVMLCNRGLGQEEGEAVRDALRDQLRNRRLSRQAEAYLAELRAEADIRRF